MSFFDPSMESMLDMFIYEADSLIQNLDEILLSAEKEKDFTDENINEIFRIMHTIKGSSSMMGIMDTAKLAHSVENMFFIIRDDPSILSGHEDIVFDSVFNATDFLRNEISLVENDDYTPNNTEDLIKDIEKCIDILKADENLKVESEQQQSKTENENNDAKVENISDNKTTSEVKEVQEQKNSAEKERQNTFSIKVFFEDEGGMENIRAFMLMNSLKDFCDNLTCYPESPENNKDAASIISKNGFSVSFTNKDAIKLVEPIVSSATGIKSFEVSENIVSEEPEVSSDKKNTANNKKDTKDKKSTDKKTSGTQNIISVKQVKLDELMDLVGEIVIAESMVISNPDLKGLNLDNFYKSSRHLRKLTDQLQDIVMSIRMVPISIIFTKMNRLIRDISKKLNKSITLTTQGDNTEVDKTIIDIIGDPFMHMVRNAVDHGIDTPDEREALGKSTTGSIVLSAENIGSDIVIKISDDGRGLDPDVIYNKAIEKGMTLKSREECSDKEIFSLIMQPGFSTKDKVTEYSGRGVGMDVVKQNIEKVNGHVTVDSVINEGTTFTIKIPLTLAIITGMTLTVGESIFTIPLNYIRESFTLDDKEILKDTNEQDMIMLRDECFHIIKLYDFYGISNAVTELSEGIFILVEYDDAKICLFVDKLVDEQQVVVKPFPSYFHKYNIKDKGLDGCTILGDGNISLILDISKLLQ